MSARAWITIAVLCLLLVGTASLRLSIRSRSIQDRQAGVPVLQTPEDSQILALRARRVLAALCVGSALAVGGVALQTLLRNPLASPDLLGLAAGAGLAIVIARYADHLAGLGLGASVRDPLPALIGSLATLALLYMLSQRRGLVEPISLVLTGVILSVMGGAATVFVVQSLLPPSPGAAGSAWMFGAISDEVTWGQLALVGFVTAAGVVVCLRAAPAMDAATLGDDEARSVGVRLGALRVTLLLVSGVLTAGAVVLAGPIGFVGLVCPHVVRLSAGPAHGPLIVGAALAGATLVIGADTGVSAAASIWPTLGRVPIGVVTALIGGPVFILLLRRQQGGS